MVQGHKTSITVNELIRTFHHIQFEGNSKRLFLVQGMFSVHSVYFDEVLLLIVAVCINSYYLLVSIIIGEQQECVRFPLTACLLLLFS